MRRIKLAMLAAALTAPLIAAPAFADGHAETGSFIGASNHVTSGSAELVKTETGYQIILGEDFSFDGAPDPRVGLGSGGAFAEGTDFEPLRENAGRQVYDVPAGIDAAAFDEIWIWCRRYAVPLGVAALK